MPVLQPLMFALASLFLFAAAFKASNTRPLRATLQTLGLPDGLAGLIAKATPPYEVLLASALVGLLPHLVAAPLLGICGLAILLAGVRAWRLADPVRCTCFSPSASGTLGGRQVAFGAASIATAAALIVSGAPTTSNSEEEAIVLLIGAVCVAVVAHAVAAASTTRELITHRRAATSRYTI